MVDINDLSFGYRKNRPLFNNLNLHLPTGNIYGLLGKNGAGKTTLLKHIVGLLYPQKGDCCVMEQSTKLRSPEVLSEIYFIPEEFQLPAINIKLFVKLHAPFYPRFSQTDFEKYLYEFAVDETAIVGNLSYGQKKKFLISFGLATNTKLLILDEPTNGLDIPSKSQFRKIIASSMDEQRSIIISTHQVRDLSSLIDHIIILDSGKVVFQQSTYDITSKLAFGQSKNTDASNVIYHEEVLGGYAVISRVDGEETQIDMELLFNGVTANPMVINNVFKN